MRHGDKVKKLGRRVGHRTSLLKNLVAALFVHERIRTTLPKAKEARRLADRLISFALSNTVAARREAAKIITDKALLKKLFNEIGPRFVDRPGGWTRVLRLGPRPGDAAEMAILELVVRKESHKELEAKERAAKERGSRGRGGKTGKTDKGAAPSEGRRKKGEA